jgi:hypothetical protein
MHCFLFPWFLTFVPFSYFLLLSVFIDLFCSRFQSLTLISMKSWYFWPFCVIVFTNFHLLLWQVGHGKMQLTVILVCGLVMAADLSEIMALILSAKMSQFDFCVDETQKSWLGKYWNINDPICRIMKLNDESPLVSSFHLYISNVDRHRHLPFTCMFSQNERSTDLFTSNVCIKPNVYLHIRSASTWVLFPLRVSIGSPSN